ncbi:MAG: RraA family protein [Armatimonadota bacterium]|nr:RraA family protein [Armatimonadota bacterium]
MVPSGAERASNDSTVLAAAVDRLRGASPAWVSDAQGAAQTMDAGIKPVWPGARVVGPAYTARCYPGSIVTVHKALLEAPAGAVIVADNSGEVSGALFGELMATEATARRLAGVVIDGAVRDADGLAALRFPAFARAVTPRVGTNRRVGATQVEVVCGGVVVHPGDVIVAAQDGVAVIPRARLTEVLQAVAAVEQKEADIRRRMDQGERLADILGMRALIDPHGG